MIKYSKIYIVLSLILGAVFGIGLLTYSGVELVNVMVFLAVAVFIPLLFSLISFGSILYNFFKKDTILWQGLKFSNQIGFLFSFGLLLAFLLTIATRDIAFGWSTTLDIDANEIHQFLAYFAFWKDILPSAFIDVKLIELSHFQRLGNSITQEQISNAQILGSWWKFLGMMVLVWGAGVRFVLCQLSRLGVKLSSRTPVINRYATSEEKEFTPLCDEYKNRVKLSLLEDKNYQLLSYSIEEKMLLNIIDIFDIKSSISHNFALTQSIEDDEKQIKLLKNQDSIVVVKSWEPPTMDFIDFLDDISKSLDLSKIYLLAVGLEKENFKSSEKELNIWLRKLKETNHENIISLV